MNIAPGTITTKRCTKCKMVKVASEFSPDPRHSDKLSCECNPCKRARMREYTRANKEHVKRVHTTWRRKNELAGLCRDCARPRDGKHTRCKPCLIRKCKDTTQRKILARQECFQHYGGAICACCGETIERFLTLDHINGDGAKHRTMIAGSREKRNMVGGNIYLWLKRRGFPPGFQVLCFNCNCGRSVNGGICPHQQMKGAVLAA